VCSSDLVVVATKHGNYEKVVSNNEEVKARKGKIIAIVTQGDKETLLMVEKMHVMEEPFTM
jgi:glucosamine--fructose-6-phosphate aminotransferase (isomerizing)